MDSKRIKTMKANEIIKEVREMLDLLEEKLLSKDAELSRALNALEVERIENRQLVATAMQLRSELDNIKGH